MNRPLACAALASLVACAPLAHALEAEEPAPRGVRAEPRIERRVVEDDGARIEELRVRGRTQSISVTPKGAIRQPYEILPADAGRELTPQGPAPGGAAGQRVWRVYSF
ncbi:MAG TPA: hypothetical protein VFX50_05780 [Gemmatimonadales bacterium]|nr:hypothetical protein [Gemmatimonadales bacterium]